MPANDLPLTVNEMATLFLLILVAGFALLTWTMVRYGRTPPEPKTYRDMDALLAARTRGEVRYYLKVLERLMNGSDGDAGR